MHFEDVDETEKQDTLTQLEFVHWLTEGRHDCEVAYTLLQAWTSFFKSSGNDALPDFFAELVHEEELTKKSAPAQDTPSVTHPPDSVEKHKKVISLSFLASLIRKRCILPFHVATALPNEIEEEIHGRILEEHRAIQAYVRTWQSSGAYPLHPEQPVQHQIEESVNALEYPWPTIGTMPVPETSDGRLVKSHPLEFPMGQGDYRQPRLCATFSPFDYVQHKFRYFDGRFLSTLRGQRVTWALFNIALRENSHHVGSMVHKQSGQSALTKADLRQLVIEREDLVRRIAAFGAEIPTTPMFWKRHGNELEWIVRQMSWTPPWCAPNPARPESPAKKFCVKRR